MREHPLLARRDRLEHHPPIKRIRYVIGSRAKEIVLGPNTSRDLVPAKTGRTRSKPAFHILHPRLRELIVDRTGAGRTAMTRDPRACVLPRAVFSNLLDPRVVGTGVPLIRREWCRSKTERDFHTQRVILQPIINHAPKCPPGLGCMLTTRSIWRTECLDGVWPDTRDPSRPSEMPRTEQGALPAAAPARSIARA